jgi:hypothetical protein
MSVKITGLDTLQRQLKEAQRALESLNGTITTLRFSPDDPDSVQQAIRQMEAAVDAKVRPYGQNPLVSTLAQAAKESFRKGILERAKRPEGSGHRKP